MEFSYRHGSESQDSADEPVPPGTPIEDLKTIYSPSTSVSSPVLPSSSKGVENAKKRLRAFSIQKKAPVAPVTVVKPVSTGNTTVLIGKLCSAKVTPKLEKPTDDEKKVPKPPKPGGSKKYLNESYSELQKKTLSEIEEMKRKLELVELGVPLGLVCPSTNALPVKAMPTKAMPPIKTFLDNAKIDEIIREARKAKAEGKEFKFDYHKFVPDYDNPFQRKKDYPDQKTEGTPDAADKKDDEYKKPGTDKDRRVKDFKDKSRRKSDRYDRRQDFKRDDRDKYRDKGRPREKDKKEDNRSKSRDDKRDMDHKSRDRDDKYKKDDKSFKKDIKSEVPKDKSKAESKEEAKKNTEKPSGKLEKDAKETDVNLNDYLVCDSWSLDTEGKNSPQVEDKTKKGVKEKSRKGLGKDIVIPIDPLEQLRQSLGKNKGPTPKTKIEKLKPVVDCFEFEIDPNEDELLDIFDEYSNINKFSQNTKKDTLYDSPVLIKYDKKDLANDGMNDDMFLESVINEIKQENMSDDEPHDKGLVEYDESPVKSQEPSIGSVTPDLDDSIRGSSQRSDYSDGYKSVDSRKSTESGYKSTESGYKFENKATEVNKTNSKFTDSGFKPIEPAHNCERFKSTFKPAESDSKTTDSRSRTTEHLKSSQNRSKSSEGCSKTKSKGKCKASEQREILSVERELEEALEAKMSKDTVDSLETWSFVLKICQPLLFRHDKNKCYKETRTIPKLWFTQNPKLCNCVTDRTIVYEELERCKMNLVDTLYGCDQIPDHPLVIARTWYLRQDQCLVENPAPMQLSSEWDVDDDQSKQDRSSMSSMTPRNEDESLDREYQKFMEAVSWSETSQPAERSMTPLRLERKTRIDDQDCKKDAKRMKMSSEGWSQESEVDEEEKTKTQKSDKLKQKERRKRKRIPSTLSSGSDSEQEGKKKTAKKKDDKKTKSKAKRRRLEKKMLKKLKDKKKKRKVEKVEEESELEKETEKETKKREKKTKKKKQQKVKNKAEKKKKRAKSTSTSSSSSSSSSDSSSDSEATEKKAKKKKKELEVKKKKKKEKKKKRKQSTSESRSEDLFDVNILNNIKTERLTDDERKQDLSPVKKPREIINVKELQDDFSSNIQVKQEVEEESKRTHPAEESPKLVETQNECRNVDEKKPIEKEVPIEVEEVPKKVEGDTKKVEEIREKMKQAPKKVENVSKNVDVSKEVEVSKVESEAELMNRFDLDDQYSAVEEKPEKVVFKEPEVPTPPPRLDDTSQCSSQESVHSLTSSVKEQTYEKDDSHLRPSCDNSNYSFNDVINSQSGYKNMEEKFEGYENYEIYEQMAMAYQSDVASQQISPPSSTGEQRIETVVRVRARGEIKCDWRASDGPAPGTTHRPSRWGLKPGEVNIVLTGGGEAETTPEATPASRPVYKIQSLANRPDTMGYDEAYMDTYGAADRLQYGDCFAPARAPAPPRAPPPARARSLDARIQRALRGSVLGEAARDDDANKDTPEKGILVIKSLSESRRNKRVSFADGYRPGQDSDSEQPPAKRRKKSRRLGCAWPCPAAHPDHVPLWDALPPPPPPPGSPPPPARPAPPLHLLRPALREPALPTSQRALQQKFTPAATMPSFMPPEPPPGLISFS